MSEPVSLSIGLLAAPGQAEDGRHVVIDLGPEHPSRTGMLQLRAELADGLLHQVRIQPGFAHRSVEKLFEVRDYRQVMVLADRHDWQSPFTGELLVALAAEHLMGLVTPPRAVWLRTLLAEHARISSHLAHLSFVGFRLGDTELAADTRHVRENGRALMLAASGNRVHPMLNRLGGLAFDVPPPVLEAFARWSSDAAAVAARIGDRLRNSGLGKSVAVVDARKTEQFGLAGPAALAAGCTWDLRASSQYLAYGELTEELEIRVAEPTGDAAARLDVLCAQVVQSSRIIMACEQRLRRIDSPVDTKLSKIIKLPDAETYLAIEAPWGPAGVLLVSRAERTPWRLKLRTPSFANVQALEAVLEGCPLDQADVAAASLGWTSGDLDK